MAFYRDRISPRLLDLAMDTAASREVRARVCAGLTGAVVDPSAVGARLAAGRVRATPVAVVFTPDPVQALREIGRVLRPGGSLHFVEHGAGFRIERVDAYYLRDAPRLLGSTYEGVAVPG